MKIVRAIAVLRLAVQRPDVVRTLKPLIDAWQKDVDGEAGKGK